jgi:hypothetical protein
MSFHFNPKLVTDGLIWAMDIANPASFTPPNGGINNNINDLTIYNNNFTLISSSAERPYTYSPNNLGSMDFYNDQIGSPTLGSHAQLNSVINTGDNFSVFFWVKPYSGSIASPSFGRNTIMTNAYKFDTAPSRKCGWFFLTFISFQNPSPTVFNGFSFAIGRDRAVISCPNSLDMNNWNYIGVTIAGAGATKKAYKNGIEISPSTNYDGTPNTITYNAFLTSSLAKRTGGGLNENNLPDRFSGSLAAGHIYNRVLTPQEIGQNYNAYKVRFGLT